MQEEHTLEFRNPKLSDSPQLFSLVTRSKPLDVNSRYVYMLVASHFQTTSIVATQGEKVVGFVSGYTLPQSPQTLFVWQVAVDESTRGRGLAVQMIEHLLTQLPMVRQIHTTITPSNVPSRRLFERIAAKLDAPIRSERGFECTLFGEDAHEEELLYVIGPLHVKEKL
ncbi:MAG: diaminobutyrate acetyltransferase [Campylobacterales bacterium]|nr:diaminobutyrate acetyltransferase [Campylobacterales bacterium]